MYVFYLIVLGLYHVSKASTQPLPIQTQFDLPSELPKWPSGGGFGNGVIVVGGLQVRQISTFQKIWATFEGGPDNLGATFFEPSLLPYGFFMLGYYSQPNNRPLFGSVLVAKDSTTYNKAILAIPTDYTLVWNSENLKIKQDGVGYLWLPTPPAGYEAVGHVVTRSPQKPSLDKIRCVRSDYVEFSDKTRGAWIWGDDYEGFHVYDSRPDVSHDMFFGIPTGSFIALKSFNGTTTTSTLISSSAYIKNIDDVLSAMPDLGQMQALFKEYAPFIYFHPNEDFFPSSVDWFIENGAMLYMKTPFGDTAVSLAGTIIPQGGSNDGLYWLDLPSDSREKDRVAKGNLESAKVYIHAKAVQGGSCTDIAVWLFYPYNGAARAKFLFLTIKLGRMGEHVGDWEHVTLRINNFNGKLISVYYSQHDKGQWVSASDLTYKTGTNKPLVYASLHGHASYPYPGDYVTGLKQLGIRNDADESEFILDTGGNYQVVGADYLGQGGYHVIEPPWLNFAREWGPKIIYNIDDEINTVLNDLPVMLRRLFRKLVAKLPPELLGEEGPLGPKFKDSWNGNETETWASSFFDI